MNKNMTDFYKAKLKSNGEWIVGSYLRYHHKFYIVPEDGNLNSLDNYEVDENTICGNTGLYNLGEYPLYEHDYIKVNFPYFGKETKNNIIYEIRKEYDIPGGSWSNSGFILDQVGVADFLTFEDTIDDYTNEISVEVVGNKFDGVAKK